MSTWAPPSSSQDPMTIRTSRWERLATNLFLVTILTVFVLDSWPSQTWDTPEGHISQTQEWLDPYVDVTALWQGPWYLFSPVPPTENIYVRARLIYQHPNGTILERQWFSPLWQTKWAGPPSTTISESEKKKKKWWSPIQDLASAEEAHWVTSVWEKKRLFRMQEYFEEVRNDNNQAVWPPLAEHLADTHPLKLGSTGQVLYPKMVGLYRHWQDTSNPVLPTPSPEKSHWLLGEKVEPPRDAEFSNYMFYGWSDQWRTRPPPGGQQQEEEETKGATTTEL